MAANLLLEGPDLEALLLRAHQEGGAQAKIVRAEKIRRGGLLGFFAREGFEVAVEIPADGGSADGARTPDAAGTPETTGVPAPGPVAEVTPIPTGLMGLADRVSNQERHAETVTRLPEYRFAEAALGAIPAFEPAVFPEQDSWPAATTGPIGMPHEETESEPAAETHRPDDATPSAPVADLDAPEGTPSGDGTPLLRPQFTALIDQLRVGVREGRHREEGVRHTADHPVVAALHAGLTEAHDTSTAHIVSALEAEAWAQVRTAATAEPPTGTDGSAMPEPATDASPERTAPAKPETGARIADEADVPSQEPSNRNATIVPSRPVKRSRRGVPAQRHVEPEQTLEQVIERAGDPVPVLDESAEPDAETAGPSGPVDEQHAPDDEPGSRRAGWWRLNRRRRARAEEATELWTAEDDERFAADVHWSAADAAEDVAPDLPGLPDLPATAEVPQAAGVHDIPAPAPAGFTAAAMSGRPSIPQLSTIADGDELAEDRQTLRDLGIPAAWTRRLQPGDRFASILAILDRLPEVAIAEDARVIAVVGPADVVQLEAHRTALDLPADGRPRHVVALPAADGKQRRNAIARAVSTRPVVVAIPLEPAEDPERARAAIRAVRAEAVIAIVDADQPLEAMTRFIESLERVDAVALDGALEAEQPAAVLSLDVPVVRLDGISVDRIGWAALLCAQLTARDPQLLAQAG